MTTGSSGLDPSCAGSTVRMSSLNPLRALSGKGAFPVLQPDTPHSTKPPNIFRLRGLAVQMYFMHPDSFKRNNWKQLHWTECACNDYWHHKNKNGGKISISNVRASRRLEGWPLCSKIMTLLTRIRKGSGTNQTAS